MEIDLFAQDAIKTEVIGGQKYLIGKQLPNNIAMERRYAAKLEGIAKGVAKATRDAVHEYYNRPQVAAYFATDGVADEARATFLLLRRKLEQTIEQLAPEYAEEMVAAVNSQSDRAVTNSIKTITRYLGEDMTIPAPTGKILEIIQATVGENVMYIKSIPFNYLKNVEGFVMRSIAEPTSGGTKELIANLDAMLYKQSKEIHNKAKNLALDQIRKAYNNLNAQRMQNAGIDEFIWRHTHAGQRSRPLHKDVLDGQVYSFNDLPVIDDRTGARGIPGQAINCKCYMIPVIKIGGETAPKPSPLAWHQ